MSTHEALSEQERALAQRLREWSVVGPSAELDASILAQARAEVATSAPRRRRQRPFLVGLASAAVLVLTVGVIWQVAEQPPESLPMPAPAQPEFRAGPQPSSSDPQPAADSYDGLAEADLDAPAAAANAIGRESAPAARVEDDAPPVFMEPPPASPDAPAAGRALRTSPAPAPPPRPSDLPEPRPSVSSPPMRYAPATEASAPPAPSAPPVPPPVSAAAAQQRTEASAAGALGREQEPPRKTAEERARDERVDRSALAIGVPDPPSESQALTGPALAIAHIRRLIVTGQSAGALTRIAELRDNYPELELPDDLLLFEHEQQQP